MPVTNGLPYFHRTGDTLRTTSVEISHKYFESALFYKPGVKATYVLKLSTNPEITAVSDVTVQVKGTLYTSTGHQIWTGTTNAHTPVFSLRDENAFHNVYADAIKQLLDQALKSKHNSIVATAKSTPYQSVIFKNATANLNTVSTGTGFFINDAGVIATIAHVVKRCLAITVMHNGEEYDAIPVSNDTDSDLALIKIDTTGNKYARILPKHGTVRLVCRIHRSAAVQRISNNFIQG